MSQLRDQRKAPERHVIRCYVMVWCPLCVQFHPASRCSIRPDPASTSAWETRYSWTAEPLVDRLRMSRGFTGYGYDEFHIRRIAIASPWPAQSSNKSSAVAEMAVQFCRNRMFAFEWAYLSLTTHSFPVIFDNITISHILLKTRFFVLQLYSLI